MPVRLPPGRSRRVTRPFLHRIGAGNEDDRDRFGQRPRGRRSARISHDESDAALDQIGGEYRQSLIVVVREAALDCQVAAITVEPLRHGQTKGAETDMLAPTATASHSILLPIRRRMYPSWQVNPNYRAPAGRPRALPDASQRI